MVEINRSVPVLAVLDDYVKRTRVIKKTSRAFEIRVLNDI